MGDHSDTRRRSVRGDRRLIHLCDNRRRSETAWGSHPKRSLTSHIDLTDWRDAVKATGPCSTDDCDRPSYARKLCRPHYDRWRAAQPGAPRCEVAGCDRMHSARGFCKKHYSNWLENPAASRAEVRGCSVEGCDRPHVAKSFCGQHYRQQWERTRTAQCSVDGCDFPPHARGLCGTHTFRVRRTGDAGAAERQTHPRRGHCATEGCGNVDDGGHGLCRRHYRPHWLRSRDLAKVPLCSVDTCGRPIVARGWCALHYGRWQTTGRVYLTPRPVRHCSVAGCQLRYFKSGYCGKHLYRWRNYGNPLARDTSGPPNHWRGPATYSQMHKNVRRKRGPASLYPCEHCWSARAHHWAYDHSEHDDPAERFAPTAGPFSVDVNRYRPLCVPCHTTFDMGWRRITRGGEYVARRV